VKAFIKSCVSVISRRGKLIAFFNVVYFGAFFAVVLLSSLMFPPPLAEETPNTVWVPFSDNPFLLGAGIFAWNLTVSAFAVVTLPGMLLFLWSPAFITYRAMLWGFLFYPLPGWAFAVALPTLIFEGEAYVFAAVAGTIIGFSWIKPKWMFRGEELSRWESLKRAFGEAKQLYKAVMLFLLVAAIFETVTIFSF
jgi:hypothetical protein